MNRLIMPSVIIIVFILMDIIKPFKELPYSFIWNGLLGGAIVYLVVKLIIHSQRVKEDNKKM